MTSPTGFADRDAVLAYLSRQLIGPVNGTDEVLDPTENPHERYLTGLLYPQTVDADALARDGAEDDDGEEVAETTAALQADDDEDPVTMAGQSKPSSVGISFVAEQVCPIQVELRAGTYEQKSTSGGEWVRTAHELTGSTALTVEPPPDGSLRDSVRVLGDRAELYVRWRPHETAWVVTVVLINRREKPVRALVDSTDCLFQVELRCTPTTGVIRPYPTRNHLNPDDEAAELHLQYRDVLVYALGHGCAAAWDDGTHTHSVRTTFLPVHVVPDIAFDIEGDDEVLRLRRLSGIQREPAEVCALLHDFVHGYERWIADVRASATAGLDDVLAQAAERILTRAAVAAQRMRTGIEILAAAEHNAQRAFALANEAMLRQMVHGTAELAGAPHAPSDAPDLTLVDYDDFDPRWRPFQLGFLLLNIEGITHDGADRDVVDLVWFPTGGGKTEAYLGLAAFTIFYRRLEHGERGAGTTVITRYTLRLLTTQQFQRAATMIAACEVLRTDAKADLGSTPISIGIWVGGSNTPNSYSEAVKLVDDLRHERRVGQGFQIEMCPWCGTRIVPGPEDVHQDIGIVATNNAFFITCLNITCPFNRRLPMSSVDEDLYDNPPTMVVGTVDKFARATWDPKAGALLGVGGSMGPSLIIQDEFHLISGPLGTIVGLYEAAFDIVMRSTGNRPKIVAATATIRNAEQQTRGVFGRPVRLFPPAGVDAGESYFVRTNHDSPGRAYAGVMPQGHSPVTGLVHLASALLQAPRDAAIASGEARDAYSTLITYHNSLRELGKTMTLARDDIPARVRVIATAQDRLRDLNDDNIVELTSNIDSIRIPHILQRLGEPAESGIALLASTNMISVGVDVTRLGLMAVVGQPKTTAEYVQASSRVGRDRSRPGLVLTLYSATKPRDRSHYESFIPYHSALYRAVEPTSVTPFSVAARDRALHADLVILVRHVLGLGGRTDAARFDADAAELSTLLADFLDRARHADPAEAEAVEDHLMKLRDEWAAEISRNSDDGGLVYSGWGNQPKLLRQFNERRGTWATLNSMRNVDVEVPVHVEGTRT